MKYSGVARESLLSATLRDFSQSRDWASDEKLEPDFQPVHQFNRLNHCVNTGEKGFEKSAEIKANKK